MSNYETFSYYVDLEERLFLSQPASVIQTEDLFAPLTTDLETEILQEGDVTLKISLTEEENKIVIKANFIMKSYQSHFASLAIKRFYYASFAGLMEKNALHA